MAARLVPATTYNPTHQKSALHMGQHMCQHIARPTTTRTLSEQSMTTAQASNQISLALVLRNPQNDWWDVQEGMDCRISERKNRAAQCKDVTFAMVMLPCAAAISLLRSNSPASRR